MAIEVDAKDNFLSGKVQALTQIWTHVLENNTSSFTFAGIPQSIESKEIKYNLIKLEFDEHKARQMEKLSASSDFNKFSILLATINFVLSKHAYFSDVSIKTPWLAHSNEDVDDFKELGVYYSVDCDNLLKDFLKDFRRQLLKQYTLQNSWDIFEAQNVSLSNKITNVFCYSPQVNSSASPFGQYDIIIDIQLAVNSIKMNLHYNSLIYEAGLIQQFINNLENFIGELSNTEVPLNQINTLSIGDNNLLQSTLNHTDDLDSFQDTTVIKTFEAVVEAMPEAIAVVHGGQRFTYRDIEDKANQLANYLHEEYDLEEGDVIGVLLPRSEASIISMLAVMKAGYTYLPLPYTFSPEPLKRNIEEAHVKVLLVNSVVLSNSPALHGDTPMFEVDFQLNTLSTSKKFDRHEVHPDSLAYLIYTSGSMGQSKCVEVLHKSISNTIAWRTDYYKFKPTDNHLLLFSTAFDGSLTAIFSPLLSGGTLVIPDEELNSDPEHLKNLITDNDVSHFIAVPTLYNVLLSNFSSVLQNLSMITLAGEAVSSELVSFHYKELQNVRLYNEYGPTENAVCSTCTLLNPSENVTIGKPISNVKTYIVDESLSLLPQGAVGELCLSGINLARGYKNNIELTNQKFISAKFLESGALIYRTGDQARIDENANIEFLGRVDSQLKIRGFRVEPDEVEYRLSQIEGIDQCAVVGKLRNDQLSLAAYHTKTKKISLFPSLAEYLIYDDVLYHTMANDENRNKRYIEALKKVIKDKIVLEIGPGAEAVLSLLCVKHGAAKVYAVEILEESYIKAKEKISELGLEDKITLIHGDIMDVELPEKADYCVSEIVGAIGGAEGAAKIINATHRLMHDPRCMIPAKSITRIAATVLPENEFDYSFSEMGAHYVEFIFSKIGKRFDLRLCLDSFEKKNIISDYGVLEDLDFREIIELEHEHQVKLKINKDGPMSGLVVWLNLYCDEEEIIDALEEKYIWLPVYFPIFSDTQDVQQGDELDITIRRQLSTNGLNPDYLLEGYLKRINGTKVSFYYESCNISNDYQANDFYRKIFSNDHLKIDPTIDQNKIKEHLKKWLPDYMIPSQFIEMESLPSTVSGKINRRALAEMEDFQEVKSSDYRKPENDIEKMLLDVWKEVLDINTININSDFINSGGDSIKAIQIASRIYNLGYKMEVKDLLKLATIEKVAPLVKKVKNIEDQSVVEGELPLTPIQAQFFHTIDRDLFHFNQAVLLLAKHGFNKDILEEIFNHILTHHDALRMVFKKEGHSYIQQNKGLPDDISIEEFDLKNETNYHSKVEEISNKAQRSMDLEQGPLVKLVLFRTLEGDRLLIIMHHLVVDGVSWRIITEDIMTLYQQYLKNLPLKLPLKTTSYLNWSHKITEIAAEGKFNSQTPYWESVVASSFDVIEKDFNEVENQSSDTLKTYFQLDKDNTNALLTQVHKTFNTEINDILLTALALSLQKVYGGNKYLIELEGHGREHIMEEIDISRTVGWFTTSFPFALEALSENDLATQLNTIKDCLREVPDKGIGYGVLKYISDENGGIRNDLQFDAPILHNYLGQFNSESENSIFKMVDESVGDLRSKNTARQHLLVINSIISQDKLRFSVEYNLKHFHEETIVNLGEHYLTALREVISLCKNSQPSMVTEDFYYNDLSNEELDTIFD